MITSKELGDRFHEVSKEVAVAVVFLYTLGNFLGEKCYRVWDTFSPLVGFTPRIYPYKAPVSVSEVVVSTPVVVTTQAVKKPRTPRIKKNNEHHKSNRSTATSSPVVV